MHILSNISRSKDNQKTKFEQLIEHNMRNNLPEKSYKICWRNYSLFPFLKNQNWANLWINSLKFYSNCFYNKVSIHGFWVQNHWLDPISTQSFILLRSIKWSLRSNLVVKIKLFPSSGYTALRQLSLIHEKRP